MIQPDEIRRKAANLYPAFLRAWLQGESFFPRTIPCRKRPEEDLAAAMTAVQRVKEESKAVRGFGYSVEWAEINSRKYGRNLFPKRIVLESEADFLRYIGRQQEFEAFAQSVGKIRARYPQLEAWIGSHIQLLIESTGEVERLLQVVDYLCAHPRPGLFARQIPVAVDTKFIERNRRILREWLDLTLPPQTIRADEEHFERRFGLRYAEPHIMIRFLDPEVQRASCCAWPELSLPLHTLGEMPVDVEHILLVENKINLLTLPPLAGTLALGGLGNSVTDLRHVPWLASCDLWYWGDLDVEGLLILSRLRTVLPQARSLLMDDETVAQWRDEFAGPGAGYRWTTPPGLTEGEQNAFRICVEQNLRLEQERFPQEFVATFLRSVFGVPQRERTFLASSVSDRE